MVVIGIGEAGCKIASCFSKGHKKILLDIDKFPSTCKKVEDFESKCPSFKKELTFRQKECWVFVCGAGKVSGATLRILEKIKTKKINIVYICPDPILATPIQLKRHKVAINILQEYVRSGLLNSMYLVSNREILNIAGEGPISSMYESANRMIANVIESVEFFKKQTPVLGSIAETKDISRIKTFGIGNLEKNEENLAFLLDNVTEIGYIYSVSQDQLDQQNDLLNIIKDRISKDKENKILSSFAIFSSEYEQSFFYSIQSTHYIQKGE
jgi:hypothetical protein